MFTIKYRSHRLADAQDSETYPRFVAHEQISGPYAFVSQEIENGRAVVYCHDEHGDSRLMLGPWVPAGPADGIPEGPRPTVYVMNASGATVAKYDL